MRAGDGDGREREKRIRHVTGTMRDGVGLRTDAVIEAVDKNSHKKLPQMHKRQRVGQQTLS
jgi:hypothetical protein